MGTEAPSAGRARLTGVRAVLFDLDGTLVDAFGDITAATNHALGRLGLPLLSYDTVRGFVGNGIRKLAERALGAEQARVQGRIEELVDLLEAYYREHPADHATVYPGAQETLRGLRARGVRTGLVSNKPHELTVAALERLGLAPGLDCILGEKPEFGRKPDPAGVRHVMETLGATAGQTVMVGDGIPDAEVARRAGMRLVGVDYGLATAEQLRGLGAEAVISRLPELLELLAG